VINCYVVMERVFDRFGEHDDRPRLVCKYESAAKLLIKNTQELDKTRDLWIEKVEFTLETTKKLKVQP